MRAFEVLPQSAGEAPVADPFDVLRAGNVDDLDQVFARYRDEPEALRRVVRLPTPEATDDLDNSLRDAVLAASDALARRWHEHWAVAADGWQLLRRLAKGGRHGSPMIPRELVVEHPGSGLLGQGSGDPLGRWVLVSATTVDHEKHELKTEYLPADLTDGTLRRARQAALDAIAVTREIANAQVYRMQSRSKWAMPQDALRLVSREQARILRAESR